MDTQTPRLGEIWQHRKSEKYCSVLGVSNPCNLVDLQGFGSLYSPMFADTTRTITVYGVVGREEQRWHLRSRYGFPIYADGPLVCYACAGNLWVLSVSDFCENFSRVDLDAPQFKNSSDSGSTTGGNTRTSALE